MPSANKTTAQIVSEWQPDFWHPPKKLTPLYTGQEINEHTFKELYQQCPTPLVVSDSKHSVDILKQFKKEDDYISSNIVGDADTIKALVADGLIKDLSAKLRKTGAAYYQTYMLKPKGKLYLLRTNQ